MRQSSPGSRSAVAQANPSSRSKRASALGTGARIADLADAKKAAPPVAVVDETFFRHLVSSMRNGVLAITRKGTVAVINDVAYRVFGLTTRPDDVGKPFAEVLRSHPEVLRILGGAFDLSHLPSRAELRLRSSGKVIGYTLCHVKDDAEEISGAVLFFKDLTHVEQVEERERLRDRLAALGEMAAGIAHELKNPLAGLEVMAGLLRRQLQDSPDALSILNDIVSEARLANAIVHDMLEFVRPLRLQVEKVAASQLLRDAITMAESKVAPGETRVMVQLAPDLPKISADPHQLSQLFTNLLVNAYEALGGKGTITITGWREDIETVGETTLDVLQSPVIRIDIADDGAGIPGEVLDRIFDPFFTSKPQGSGLGLAIVRKIVEAHEGSIDVATRPGEGTCFRVMLPVAPLSMSRATFANFHGRV